ncbi:hypothetical protein P154DRAFT_433916 [Amniculicola lignicola CBS 123094]|uniref:DUF202 domain-containing protein n=1 Tax=Amniculicola lignicola CBS 123094 TaxID=1392246 RepID=A0A6A5WTP5_9PLEO|nr:hypothetical protein P154DRAFT_433916 [Amniculicola lignicola CBS 123094]
MRHAKGVAGDYHAISPVIGARSERGGAEEERRREREAGRTAADTERHEMGWWRGVAEKYGSVELENKGSVARDHLALERTFLAWLRTSLSFASIGIAITQLFRLNTSISATPRSSSSSPNSPPTYILTSNLYSYQSSSDPSALSSPQAKLRHVGKPLGATFIGIAIVILFIGFHRYFEAQHYVIRGKFPASRGSVILVTAVAGALIVSSLVVILAVAPNAFEK